MPLAAGATSLRRWLVPAVGVGLLLLGCTRETPRPNVLLVSIDTLRADHLSAYGYERRTTPILDALAQEGVLFEQAFSHSPKTAISHMSILTGLYPESHGVLQLATAGVPRLSGQIPTLATLLRRAGYRTAGIVGGGHMDGSLGFDQGMEFYEVREELADTVARAEALMGRWADADELPFFLFLHTYEVHDPYAPPATHAGEWTSAAYDGGIPSSRELLDEATRGRGWWERHTIYWDRVNASDPADLRRLVDLYDASVRYTDDVLGGLFEWMRGRGLFENTLIVVLSDHGEEFLEHGQFLHHQIYEELLHVPLIIGFPDRSGRGGGHREQSVVRLIDVLPTVLETLGLAVPDEIQGRSLLPLLDGVEAGPPLVMSSWHKGGLQALRNGNWKLIRRRSGDRSRSELYHLKHDPHERRDLAGRRPRVLGKLESELRSRASAAHAVQRGLSEEPAVIPGEQTMQDLKALGYLQ